jgi:hypothetical protein
LREELDSLQNAFATNNARRSDEIKVKPLTQIMLQKLRKTPLSLDMICSQPSCPVCNEDYHISGMITQLPCSHFFHDACLMPWLDAKKTCPICRYSIYVYMYICIYVSLFYICICVYVCLYSYVLVDISFMMLV